MRNSGLRTGLAAAGCGGGPSRPHPVPEEFVALVHKLLSRVGLPTPDTDQYPS
ncbi:putative lipoprotein [Mycobacterium kansasii]|nr:putative lipoprotein [Mycobacterium kansasii]